MSDIIHVGPKSMPAPEPRTMKILFTKTEYRALLDMIYLAEWMLTAYLDEPEPSNEKYKHIAQKIYSHAREMGCERLVDVAKDTNEYMPSRELEEKGGVRELIEFYDSETFWDQLVDRMTDRDVKAKVGSEEADRLSAEEYWKISDPIAEAYEDEFDTHGIDRLKVSES